MYSFVSMTFHPKAKKTNMLAVLFFSFYSKMINAVLDSNFKESW